MQVKAPWIKTFFYGELDTYIIPGFHGTVTLGGSRGFDSENMKLCPYESAAIRERCETLVPSVKDAELLRQEVGLRPHREGGARIGEGNIVHSDCSNKTIVSTLIIKKSYALFTNRLHHIVFADRTQLRTWWLWSLYGTRNCYSNPRHGR